MKRAVLTAVATSLIVIATPVFGHEGDDDWTVESYADFTQQYHHIWDFIQHGMSDGSFSPRQARFYYRQLRNIQARANWEQQTGQFDPEDINNRLENLHEQMHVAHERAHERMNNDWRG